MARGATATALGELAANFADETAQGTVAYADTVSGLHTDLDYEVMANDSVAAVGSFIVGLGLDSRTGSFGVLAMNGTM